MASSNLAAEVQFSVSAAIEELYDSIFVVEDALTQESDTEYDIEHLQDCRRGAIAIVRKALLLDKTSDELGTK